MDKIVTTEELGKNGGGSSEIQTQAEHSRKGHPEPTYVSAAQIQAATPLDSMLVEQKENQDRNAFTPNSDGTSTKVS